MVVYVDILLFLNTVVDFLILSVAAALSHSNLKLWRKTVAAFASALFSLYIFLPSQIFAVELLLRLMSSAVAVLIGFGFGNVRRFSRNLIIFYAVSFIYAGLMAGIWMLWEPQKMSVNNGVVYFDISPLLLITLSFVFYVIIVVFKKLTGREAQYAGRCSVTLHYGKISAEKQAMIDSGHTLTDAFGNSAVIVIDRETSIQMLGENDTTALLAMAPPTSRETALRFRLIPVKTISGEKLLPAVKIDRAEVLEAHRTFILHKPIAVLSDGVLGDDYSVIISPDSLG